MRLLQLFHNSNLVKIQVKSLKQCLAQTEHLEHVRYYLLSPMLATVLGIEAQRLLQRSIFSQLQNVGKKDMQTKLYPFRQDYLCLPGVYYRGILINVITQGNLNSAPIKTPKLEWGAIFKVKKLCGWWWQNRGWTFSINGMIKSSVIKHYYSFRSAFNL